MYAHDTIETKFGPLLPTAATAEKITAAGYPFAGIAEDNPAAALQALADRHDNAWMDEAPKPCATCTSAGTLYRGRPCEESAADSLPGCYQSDTCHPATPEPTLEPVRLKLSGVMVDPAELPGMRVADMNGNGVGWLTVEEV